jgi:hypothetical protein
VPITHSVNVRLFFRKRKLGDTFVLNCHKQIVLEKFLDKGVFEGRTGSVCTAEPCDIAVIEQGRRKVGTRVVGDDGGVSSGLETLFEFHRVWIGGVVAGVSAGHGGG